MIPQGTPQFEGGKPISARALNQLAEAADRAANVSAAAPVTLAWGPTGASLSFDAPDLLIAEITGGTQPYTWEARAAAASGTWAETAQSGTAAYEINGNEAVPAGSLVFLWQGALGEWLFDAGVSTLSAQEFNGDTSTVNAVHTLRFDYGQGFQVSGTAGVASVTIDAASVTRTGVITTGSQTIAGDKSVWTNLSINTAKVSEANGGYFQVWSDNGLSPLLKAADGVVTVNALTGDGSYPGLHAHYQRCWRADFVLLGQDLATYATFLSIGWESVSPKILYLRASDADAVDFSITGKYRAVHSSLGPQVGVEDTINGMIFTGGILTDSASALQSITTLTGALQAPTSIKDGNGNELIEFPTAQAPVGSAVNQVAFENAATGSPPSIKAAGNDTNTDLLISGKGTGGVDFNGSPLKNFSIDLND